MATKAEVLLRLWHVTRRALRHARNKDLYALKACLLARRQLIERLGPSDGVPGGAAREQRCLKKIQQAASVLCSLLQGQHARLRGQLSQCNSRRKVRDRFVGVKTHAPRFISRQA